MAKLTYKEQEVYDAIVEYMQDKGYSPCIRELCDICDISAPSSVHSILMSLTGKGVIVSRGKRQIKLVGYKLVKEGQ